MSRTEVSPDRMPGTPKLNKNNGAPPVDFQDRIRRKCPKVFKTRILDFVKGPLGSASCDLSVY